MNLKPFIGVVGTLPTVRQNVNKNIGIKNINEFVGENDDFVSLKKNNECIFHSMYNFKRRKTFIFQLLCSQRIVESSHDLSVVLTQFFSINQMKSFSEQNCVFSLYFRNYWD